MFSAWSRDKKQQHYSTVADAHIYCNVNSVIPTVQVWQFVANVDENPSFPAENKKMIQNLYKYFLVMALFIG